MVDVYHGTTASFLGRVVHHLTLFEGDKLTVDVPGYGLFDVPFEVVETLPESGNQYYKLILPDAAKKVKEEKTEG